MTIGSTEISSATPDAAAAFRRRNIGLVFQFFDLIPDFTLRQNVALQLLMDGKRMPEVRERVDALLAQLGIGDRADHALEELSGGELQRVAIARALVGNPALVLADEPTANLEERTSNEVIELFADACHSARRHQRRRHAQPGVPESGRPHALDARRAALRAP